MLAPPDNLRLWNVSLPMRLELGHIDLPKPELPHKNSYWFSGWAHITYIWTQKKNLLVYCWPDVVIMDGGGVAIGFWGKIYHLWKKSFLPLRRLVFSEHVDYFEETKELFMKYLVSSLEDGISQREFLAFVALTQVLGEVLVLVTTYKWQHRGFQMFIGGLLNVFKHFVCIVVFRQCILGLMIGNL